MAEEHEHREVDWPDGIDEIHEEPQRGLLRHASPLALLILTAVIGAAIIGLFGVEQTKSAEASGVALEVDTPIRIRSGEFFEQRIRITSDEPIDELVLGVDSGLWRDMTVNTFIPGAEEETSEGEEFRFTFGPLDAGEEFAVKIDLQVNPDIVGGTSGGMRLYDGERELVEIPLEIGVIP